MTLPSLSDYDHMGYLSFPDQHPFRKMIAYTLSRPLSWTYRQCIILQDESGKETTITAGGVHEDHPCFSPDGKRLAFISDASGTEQIYLADLNRLEPKQLTHFRYGVSHPVWSPDGTRLAFLSENRPGEEEEILKRPETPAEKEERLQAESREAIVIEDYGYKSDEKMGFVKQCATHIWICDLDGHAYKLTDTDRDHVMPVWSPDGKRLVFASNRCRKKEDHIGMDLFSAGLDGGPVTRLTENISIAFYPKPFQPLFTPDGQTIVFGGQKRDSAGNISPVRLYRISAQGGDAVSIWPDDAPCYEATCFVYNIENYGSFPQTAQISEDGRFVYFISGWQGACNIYKANIYKTPKIRSVTKGKHCCCSLNRPKDDVVLTAFCDFFSTPQLYLLDLKTKRRNRLTQTNPWLESRALSRVSELWVDTLDKKGRVHGFVMPPQQMKKNQTYPAVLYIHGGPTPFYGYAFTYEYQLLAAAGFGVIFCNPRGSGGYGPEHGAVEQAFDGTAATDLLQFLNEAVKTFPWIDKNRLGVTGGSYGGYMTNWLVTHTRCFKAAVTQRSIANHLISYASSDLTGCSAEYKDFTDFMKAELKKSPVVYADKINIPFLILHGMKDMRCPVEHAHQLYTAVKDTHPDLPVRLVLFPNANHSLTMTGPMTLRKAHYKEMIDWFVRFLKEGQL